MADFLFVSDFSSKTTLGGGTLLPEKWAVALSEKGYSTSTFVGEENHNFRPTNSRIRMSYRSLFGLGVLSKLIRRVLLERPRFIWVNQIGGEVPWSAIFVLSVLRQKVLFTSHDFMPIHPTKIAPRNLLAGTKLRFIKTAEVSLVHHLYCAIRRWLIRFYFRFCPIFVSISQMQAEIFMKSGLRVDAVIPNGISPCRCNSNVAKIPYSILFCGRLNQTGLQQVIQGIKESDESFHLFLVGDLELFNLAVNELEDCEFTYLGILSNEDLCSFMHQVEIVAVLSQYFDNYPTTNLEAIIHGSIPVTTSLTGNSSLIYEAQRCLVLKPNEIPNFTLIRNLGMFASIQELKTKISTESAMIERYLQLLNTES